MPTLSIEYAMARRTWMSFHGSIAVSSDRYAVRSSGASWMRVFGSRFHWSITSWEIRNEPSISPWRIARRRVASFTITLSVIARTAGRPPQ